jgi:DRTGG domain
MNLQEVINHLGLEILTTKNRDFSAVKPQSGYISDLLSCVMAGANPQSIWVTLQAHINIVAVGALKEVAAIIITEGARPEDSTLQKAEEEGITLLATPLPSFQVVGKLWELGLRNQS